MDSHYASSNGILHKTFEVFFAIKILSTFPHRYFRVTGLF